MRKSSVLLTCTVISLAEGHEVGFKIISSAAEDIVSRIGLDCLALPFLVVIDWVEVEVEVEILVWMMRAHGAGIVSSYKVCY